MTAQARVEGIRATPLRPEPRRAAEAVPARTPLAVVPAPLRRTGPGLIMLCCAVLLAALGLVLVMNISMSNRQYELLDLRQRQQEVTEVNERLAEQVGHLEAPQNLAARADSLGMVTVGGTGTVDAASGEVSAPPAAAEAGRISAAFVAPPAQADGAAAVEGRAAEGEIPAPRTSQGATPAAPSPTPTAEAPDR